MIAAISSWASGIVISIVISTIIEMILPNNSHKKYIKTIIGVYILFAILAPIVSFVTRKDFNFAKMLEESTQVDAKNYQEIMINTNLDQNNTIEKVYSQKIEEDILAKLNEKGYEAVITALSINFAEGEHYGSMNKVIIKITKRREVKETNSLITGVDPIEIDVSIEGSVKESMKKGEKIISEQEEKELIEFLTKEYGLKKEQVSII